MANTGKFRYDIEMNVDKSSLERSKSQFNDLLSYLQKIQVQAKQADILGTADDNIRAASKEAQILSNILNASWNPKINQLNLTKFQEQLKNSGLTVTQLKTKFDQIGQSGTFNKLATEIMGTNLQLKTTNSLLDKMSITFANTIRYGISSSVFNNLTNSLSKAYNYTKNLDQSLNDIRIVSNASANDMERFAKYANESAKNLGASTLDYTKGALIYYQQGLGEEEVKARTDITLKMANVLGSSASEVSDYMTAIWNNFAKGSDELEHFADVITALGASTASSSEEIATGLEKFAAIAKTVGLSYEYAATALATVVAQTRQSADVVGTAFKTIFARMEDLKLGETLDDGTTLGKYSSALEKAGINIKDQNGELKEMDDILNEMGAKWQTLDKDQQVALAQSVAGIRQYTQLIALMDNWDKFQQNLITAQNSEGTLQEQQEIYMDSLEAHLQRLSTEAEKTWSILFDEKGFKTLIDSLTFVVEQINDMLSGLGGGLNTIMALVAQLGVIFRKQLGNEIVRVSNNFKQWKQEVKNIDFIKETANNILLNPSMQTGLSKNKDDKGNIINENKSNEILKEQAETVQFLLKNKKLLNAEELNGALTQTKELSLLQQRLEYIEQLEKETGKQGKSLEELSKKNIENTEKDLDKIKVFYESLQEDIEDIEGFEPEYFEEYQQQENVIERIKTLKDGILKDEDTSFLTEKQSLELQQISADLEEGKILTKEQWDALDKIALQSQTYYNAKLIEEKDIHEQITKDKEKYKASLQTEITDQKTKNELLKEEVIQRDKAQKLVTKTAGMIQILTAGVGVIKNLTNDTATVEEKINSIYQGAISTASGIANATGHPIAAMLIPVIGELGKTVFELGYKWISHLIKTQSEEYKLKKRVEETAEAVKKAKDEYDELKETVNNYQDARAAIDDLTEGTIEFYEAILKSNEAAQELIEKLDLVAGIDYNIDKNGLITINEDTIEKALYSQMQQTYRAQARNYGAQANLERYYQKDIIKNFRNEVNRESITQTGNWNTMLTKDQSKYILENAEEINGSLGVISNWSGKINDNITKSTNDTTSSIDKMNVDITTAMSKYYASYNLSQNKISNYENMRADALIRGYGTQEQVTSYSSLSTETQKAIQKRITDSTKTASEVNAQDWLKNYGSFVFAGQGDIIEAELAQQGVYRDKAGMLRDANNNAFDVQKWYEELSKEEKENLSEAYFSGEYATQGELARQLDIINNLRKQASGAGLNKVSQGYVSETLYQLKNGELTSENLSKLNEEELQYVRENIANLYPENKLVYGPLAEQMSQFQSEQALTYFDDLVSKMDTTTGALRRQREESQYYYQELEAQAEALGTSAEALDFYSIAMDKADGKLHQQNIDTAEAAAAQYKFNKAYNSAIKVWDDNTEAIEAYKTALENGEDVSYDLADAMGELSKSLKEMGLSLSGEMIIDNLDKIQLMLTGTKEEAEAVYKELYKLSQIEVLKSFFGDSDKFLSKYEEIVDAIDNTQLGHGLSEQYAEELAQMINDTALTLDEIEQLADQLGIEIPMTTTSDWNGKIKDERIDIPGSVVTHRYSGQMVNPAWDGEGKPRYVNVDYQWTESTEDKTEHFLVPDTTDFTVTRNTQSVSGGFTRSISNTSSSSSGSSSEPKTVDPIDEQADRYHKVNTQITKVENSLKKLQSQQDKLVGKNLINNLIAQWEELNQQITNYDDKLKIANDEQNELAQKLSAQGVQFNADGTISNYFEIFQAQEDSVNRLIAQYNSLSAAEQEAWDNAKTVDNAKERFSQFKEDLDRYDELVSDFIPQLKQSIQDELDKQIEIQIQRFNMEITITLDMNQATRDWNAWAKRAMDGIDPEYILGNTKARLQDFYTYFNTKGSGDLQTQTKHAEDLLKELKQMDETGKSNVYGDDRAKALEDLKTYYQQLMTSITETIELQDELHQAVLDEMDEVQEKFDKQISSYSMLRDMINHDIKIIQLTLGDNAYGEMSKFYEMQQQNYEKQLDFQRQQKEFWYAEMQAAEEGSKEWESAREKWENAVKEFNSILEEGLENAKSKFENAINDIFDRLNKSLTGGLGLDYVNTQWDLINQNADRYLDTINATYGIRELEKKYIDSINKTDNVAAQQKLRKVMDEQLNNLKERDRITQYDLDRANKLYEIELARIALQDAQRNKSQMRLRRDSQGNYRYQYIADNDAISQAENELSNLYNGLYNFDKDRYNTVLNDIYSIWDNYQKAMAEAALINDPELRAEREKLIQEQYNELMMQAEDDYQIAKYNLQESFFQDWVELNDMELEQFNNLTENEKDLIMQELVPTWKNGLSEMADAFAGPQGFAEVTTNAWFEIKNAQQQYMEDTQQLEIISGQTFDSIIAGQDESIIREQILIKENQDLIESYRTELDTVKDIYDQLKQNISLYQQEYDMAKAATEQMYKYNQAELEAQRLAAAAIDEYNKAVTHTNGGMTSNVANNAWSNVGESNLQNILTGSDNNGNPANTIIAGIKNLATNAANVANTAVNATIITNKVKEMVDDTLNIIKNASSSSSSSKSSKSGNPLSTIISGIGTVLRFDTGGYTGSWDNTGRLAILDQKELVLNAQDTENMLNTVAIIRNINDALGSNTLARLASISAGNINSTSDETSLLEQNVHIDASFPNVHNAAEIEQALNNLVNAASQRANIKN